MKSVSRMLLVTLTLCGCVGCDQVSKSAARLLLASGDRQSFLAGSLRLQLVENPGSFLSLGASLSRDARFALFTGAVGLLLFGLVAAALFARRLELRQAVALALIGGGGISNFIDRIAHDGLVTDFMNVGIGWLRTGIFNLADMLIVAGVLLLLLGRSRVPHAAS